MSNIIRIFIPSRIIFFIFALVATKFIPIREGYLGAKLNPNDNYLLWIWANFDGEHFLTIAEQGYSRTNFAFFPLYPLLINLVNKLTNLPYLYAGMMLSSLFFLGSLYYLRKIILLDYPQKLAVKALILISFYPLSFYYHSVYTDSLFLFTSTASFYYARKQSWYLAAFFGFFNTFSRVTGVALVIALFVEWLLENKKNLYNFKPLAINFLRTAFMPLIIASGGLLLYMLFLQINYNDFLLFQKSMSAWKQSNIVFPPQVIFRYLKIFSEVNPNLYEYKIAILEFSSLIIYLSLTFYTILKIRVSYGIFMFILLTMVTFTGTFAGTPRYMLHLFPGFIAMSLLIKTSKQLYAVMAIFIILGLLLTGFFTRGYFVS